MKKILPVVVRPGREVKRRDLASSSSPEALKARGQAVVMMRGVMIFFWVVVMSLVWLGPNYMGSVARLVITAWFSLIVGGGQFILYRLERNRVRVERRTRGCCVECGYDLRSTPERCPECGSVLGKG